jgi:catechol 2,3-dioxygenase
VHLKTSNLDRVYAFYVDILGFDVIAKMDSALFISAGGYHHHLAFNTWESKNGKPPEFGTTGLYHVAIVYPTRKDLGDALKRLIEANWPIDGGSDHGTHEAIYLRDPDQNGLELYWDRDQKDWPLNDKGNLEFVSKPVDFEGLLALPGNT